MLTTANPAVARPAPAPSQTPAGKRLGLVANIGFTLLLVDLFVSVSRCLEIVQFRFGVYLPYLGTSLHVLPFLCAVFAGAVRRILLTSTGIFLSLLTFWMLACVPFSTWRGGSVQMIIHEWVPSLMSFLAMGLIFSIPQGRRVALTFSVGVGFIAVVSLVLAGYRNSRLSFAAGSLSNANDLAAILLLGAPFFIVALTGSTVRNAGIQPKKVILGTLALLVFIVCLRTGSRGGLLSIFAILGVVFLTRSGASKLKFAAVTVLLGGILLLTAPKYSLERYRTIFTGPQTEADFHAEMYGSERQRKQLLQQSVAATFDHPLFGVGPGVFQVYMANLEKAEGKWQEWAVSHNAYTQVSSEMGIPGFLLYVAALLTSWMGVQRIWRNRGNSMEARYLALATMCSLSGLFVGFFFAADAYQGWLPMITGFAVALNLDVARRPTAVRRDGTGARGGVSLAVSGAARPRSTFRCAPSSHPGGSHFPLFGKAAPPPATNRPIATERSVPLS